jgi:hypothetical protein
VFRHATAGICAKPLLIELKAALPLCAICRRTVAKCEEFSQKYQRQCASIVDNIQCTMKVEKS